HLANAQREELEGLVGLAKFSTTPKPGAMQGKIQTREGSYYNFDAILSVGYRTKSPQGVAFRKWANTILREYLVRGYSINLNQAKHKYQELKSLVSLLGGTIKRHDALSLSEVNTLLSVVTDYAFALDTLDAYDHETLELRGSINPSKSSFVLTYELAMTEIQRLSNLVGGESKWFALEKDDSFRSSLGQIYQTFDGQELYPTIEEKAAMLLYLVVKNHSFVDGNKRIAASLFLWFMAGNGVLYDSEDNKCIADSTLVAITLLIAESRPEEMELMVKIVVTLISHQISRNNNT
ncbi:MAG: RhuM family protein, partial [Porphyromonas sp.]|nr:RhuM family protein [Porphyromonas sp.]